MTHHVSAGGRGAKASMGETRPCSWQENAGEDMEGNNEEYKRPLGIIRRENDPSWYDDDVNSNRAKAHIHVLVRRA